VENLSLALLLLGIVFVAPVSATITSVTCAFDGVIEPTGCPIADPATYVVTSETRLCERSANCTEPKVLYTNAIAFSVNCNPWVHLWAGTGRLAGEENNAVRGYASSTDWQWNLICSSTTIERCSGTSFSQGAFVCGCTSLESGN
jgi:hypothetical protein